MQSSDPIFSTYEMSIRYLYRNLSALTPQYLLSHFFYFIAIIETSENLIYWLLQHLFLEVVLRFAFSLNLGDFLDQIS